jgi:hypothetical protein
MTSFPFVDADGRSWLALVGVPANHPAAGASGPVPGLTFYADDGETRVLAAADFPTHATGVAGPARLTPRWLDFAGLLSYAHPWPPPGPPPSQPAA